MKAILISIRPQHVANILNGLKTLEIRKKFPSDYVGWVYIYCTLGQGLVFDSEGKGLVNSKLFPYAKNCPEYNRLINGKVIARFWCDKVEEIRYLPYTDTFETNEFGDRELLIKSCLSYEDLALYLKGNNGKAIHITNLEIFDKPKEISEFGHYDNSQYQALPNGEQYKGVLEPLTRAPESYCYIEIE